jgi:putative ABC transport system permease protein
MLSNLLSDVRYALRGFARRPAFAAVVVLTLAVGIGVNVAVFSLYDQMLLRRLPVSNPNELVNFVGPGPQPGLRMCNNQGGCDEIFSYPMFRDLEDASTPFAGIAASRIVPTNLSYDGETSPGTATLVSGSYFSVLGIGPALGRVLDSQDARVVGEASTAVLSYDYWLNALGGDRAVLGKTLVVNGVPLEIVGVAPPGFDGATVGTRPQVFVPLTFDWLTLPGFGKLHDNRFAYWVYVFGRLKPGVSLEDAATAINVTYRTLLNDVEAGQARLPADQLEQFRAKAIELKPGAHGQSNASRTARTPLAVFFAATATILLIACVNLANLMLARGAARIGEMAVRGSMGAARHRLLGMLGIEALLLAGLAAIASLPVALGVLRGIGAFLPPPMSAADLSLDGRACAAAFAIATLAVLVFALVPMLKLSGTDPGRVLQANGARSFGGKGLGRFRFALATSQIALSMLLLVLAALFTQSLANIARVDLGMRTESLLTFGVAPNLNGYGAERSGMLFDQLEQQLKEQPGVVSVASSSLELLSGNAFGFNVTVEGYEPPAGGATPTNVNYIGGDFLQTFGIPLLAGRDIADSDTMDRPLVAIVNQSFAAKYKLGDDAVGKRIRVNGSDIEIVGLFRDTAYNQVKDPFSAQFALARRQSGAATAQGMTFYVRTAQAPEALLAAIPRIVAQVDPNLPATNVQTLSTQIRENVQTDWLLTSLASVLAGVATLLAAIGLYGVLSYTVALRTREIGVRLALGAEPTRVRAMVLTQVAWMAGIGLPAGIVAALLLGRLAAALLYGLAPTDPAAFVAACVLLSVVVLGASYLPARRASRVDPVVALRSE